MSFTEDELQSFNTILERRLTTHRQEMERSFEQRLSTLSRDFEQRLNQLQQELLRSLTHKLNDQQNELNIALSQKLGTQQTRLVQALGHEVEQRQQQQQQQIESALDRLLAAQLMGIEQLLNQLLSQHASPPSPGESAASGPSATHPSGEEPAPSPSPESEAIEVQAELSWDDLMEAIGRALDERLERLYSALRELARNWEQHLTVQRSSTSSAVEPYHGSQTTFQQVFQSIERLEQLVESLQVAMTANHALLSNRLYHHQHLPLERAHPSSHQSHHPGSPPGSEPHVSLAEESEED
ncbi:hypothetical protein KTAU_22460 [Thermogemmatispora aurantia]|uniref:Uncharacterized protein n=1 Tax=Thermogemmatispora aurantia TaxID=2045279 RepID=A0A5J4KA39_9CHLR|nr:hypothetical protein [Thermogemmatispora aurantia]GER83609.1 hypothetical protein KTAU_22460 [Thermogemmatispora aurantia]